MQNAELNLEEVLCCLCCPSMGEIVKIQNVLRDSLTTIEEKKAKLDNLLEDTDFCSGCYEIIYSKLEKGGCYGKR